MTRERIEQGFNRKPVKWTSHRLFGWYIYTKYKKVRCHLAAATRILLFGKRLHERKTSAKLQLVSIAMRKSLASIQIYIVYLLESRKPFYPHPVSVLPLHSIDGYSLTLSLHLSVFPFLFSLSLSVLFDRTPCTHILRYRVFILRLYSTRNSYVYECVCVHVFICIYT